MRDWIIRMIPSAANLIALLLIIIFMGLLIVGVPSYFDPFPTGEIQMGLVVVFAIGSLLGLLIVMATIYSSLQLADPKQALGLPTGSVRAMIALLLILIFIFMSIYLFRTIAGREGVPLTDLTVDEISRLDGRVQILNIQQNSAGTFDVIPLVGVTPVAEQLALQLVTILGTLVTAVSAFYFGSASSGAQTSEPVKLTIDSITPSSADASAGLVNVEITGTGFMPGAIVKLRREKMPDIDAMNINVHSIARISCTFAIDESQAGKWSAVVVNPDGRQASKDDFFHIF